MSEKSISGQLKSACKRPFSSFKSETVDKDFEADNIFGFMDDSDDVRLKEKSIEKVPVHDLTENPSYLMEFGFGNGFVWNEEVLLSPPFSSSASSSYYSQQSSSNSRGFPSLLAEKLRQKRISQETKVTEIRID